MPAEVQAPVGLATRVRVSVSAPVQLYSAIYMLGFYHLRGEVKAPWVLEVADGNPDLIRRFDEVYRPLDESGEQCSTSCWEGAEMLVYALASGTLHDEALDRFFAVLPDAAARDYGDIPMPTETPEIEELVRARLRRNTRDAEVRTRYVQVLRDAWEALRPSWEDTLLARARSDAAILERELESADDPAEVMPPHHLILREQFAPLIREATDAGTLVITPLAFSGPSGEGLHAVSIPGLLSVGFGLAASGKLESIRARADRVAQRYKALADPTRATLLMLVNRHEYSITDLAKMLGISQPTVSVHMKQLREAGLVEMTKSGQFTLYGATPARISSYLAEGATDLIGHQ